ncbi:hypothetical protein EON66_11645, partial [archaeon]
SKTRPPPCQRAALPFVSSVVQCVTAFLERAYARSADSCATPPLLLCYGLGTLKYGTNSGVQAAMLLTLRDAMQQWWDARCVSTTWSADAPAGDARTRTDAGPCAEVRTVHAGRVKETDAGCGAAVGRSSLAVHAYDPAFEAEDVTVLQQLGVVVDADDSRKDRTRSTGATVMYMPHCNCELVDEVLAVNSAADGALRRCCIVGNSLLWYRQTRHLEVVEDTRACSASTRMGDAAGVSHSGAGGCPEAVRHPHAVSRRARRQAKRDAEAAAVLGTRGPVTTTAVTVANTVPESLGGSTSGSLSDVPTLLHYAARVVLASNADELLHQSCDERPILDSSEHGVHVRSAHALRVVELNVPVKGAEETFFRAHDAT